ncbi:MAG TPA: hypothetical protein VE261_08325, partial [Gaiellaceae bacterium]|nr:hypothetical protein [Gaiellaceae bacterium]
MKAVLVALAAAAVLLLATAQAAAWTDWGDDDGSDIPWSDPSDTVDAPASEPVYNSEPAPAPEPQLNKWQIGEQQGLVPVLYSHEADYATKNGLTTTFGSTTRRDPDAGTMSRRVANVGTGEAIDLHLANGRMNRSDGRGVA